ncbi:hypothetical protein FQZ97_982800 [compost metagenome]
MEHAGAAILLAQPVGGVAQVQHRQLHGIGHGQRPFGGQVGQQHRRAVLLGRHRRGARGLDGRGRRGGQRHFGAGGLELELRLLESDLQPFGKRAARVPQVGPLQAGALQAGIVFRRDQRGLEHGRTRRHRRHERHGHQPCARKTGSRCAHPHSTITSP